MTTIYFGDQAIVQEWLVLAVSSVCVFGPARVAFYKPLAAKMLERHTSYGTFLPTFPTYLPVKHVHVSVCVLKDPGT